MLVIILLSMYLFLQNGKQTEEHRERAYRERESVQVSAHHVILVQFTNHYSKYLMQSQCIFTDHL